MIPNRITVLILVLVGGVAFAQDLIDVVTTKDGDVFKGVMRILVKVTSDSGGYLPPVFVL